MKKYIYKAYILICGLMFFASCEKELMDYEGEDCLYFDVRLSSSWIDTSLWPHQYFSAVSFGNLLVDEVDVSYKIMASGLPKDYDRAFSLTVNADSTTAVEGTDFEAFPKELVIKAGENSTTLAFKIYRTERMLNDTLQLQLQLHENEYFKLKYTSFIDGSYTPYSPDDNVMFSYNKDASVHNIFIYDVLSRPEGWYGNDVTGTGLFGKFSAKKYKLLMELTNTSIEDYTDESMPSVRASAIAETVAKFLLEKAADRDPVLDEDGTMMWVSPIQSIGGNAAWAPFTKVEDYYKN